MRRPAATAMLRRPGRARRTAARGQALVETALVLIFGLTLFIGVYAVSVAISDQQIAGEAVRAGARYGAQVGNNDYTTQSSATGCQTVANGGTGQITDPCVVDNQILQQVATGVSKLSDATVTNIVIYEPCSPKGAATACSSGSTQRCADGSYSNGNGAPYDSANDPGEVFTGSGTTWTRTAASTGLYLLSLRGQTHPNEAAIGVQVTFHYTSPTPMVKVNVTLTEYYVNCLAPSSH